ncbi:hypothetical protein PoB_000950900 [Plakobranchus ocellatus]|uniref:Uncharacterized protein n=1 Tax=Plakobranchus ocellatus TaxID=259542 RepID=A0AAV3YLU0_9GAST|nr:hypothetical protein PoB_000950900 [Plakobranchus ocellatus]
MEVSMEKMTARRQHCYLRQYQFPLDEILKCVRRGRWRDGETEGSSLASSPPMTTQASYILTSGVIMELTQQG